MNTSHNHEMCKAYFDRLSEYIDHELGDDACEEIRHHLEHCDCCAACLDTLRKTIELCHSVSDKPLPADLSRKLKDMARNVSA